MAQRTIKLTLEYDGTDFVGWQYQENGRSVQHVIEIGLSQILQENIRIAGAGRTDSGVHAKGQVASFQTESSLNCSMIVRGLNGVLPKDVVALDVRDAPKGFHARFNARSRRYEYVIRTSPSAIARRYSWALRYKLDIESMRTCLGDILGLHDFTSFCKTDSEVNHHNCTIHEVLWRKHDDATIVFDITADRFLHGMVRALVGTMVEVGRGYRSVDDFKPIMDAKDRRRAGVAAPPHGLFLCAVNYEE
jgi:tRNA pseudouridine38-40 synthase